MPPLPISSIIVLAENRAGLEDGAVDGVEHIADFEAALGSGTGLRGRRRRGRWKRGMGIH